jgi:hypothetical protein
MQIGHEKTFEYVFDLKKKKKKKLFLLVEAMWNVKVFWLAYGSELMCRCVDSLKAGTNNANNKYNKIYNACN